MSAGLTAFLSQAPEGATETLCLLAQAESLTDETARDLYALAPVPDVDAALFVRALHFSDLVRPRNSEWHFAPAVREALLARPAPAEAVRKAHALLLSIARTGDPAEARIRIPSYLFTPAGQAYHLAGSDDPAEALALYSASALDTDSSRQWLAERLATEQERRAIIPEGTLEVTFLKAMSLYRAGQRTQAQALFESLAGQPGDRIEIAIACHLLGNMIARRRPADAEKLYERSIAIGESVSNQFHVGQVLHSLANLISDDRRRRPEAERTYRRSIEIDEAVKNDRGLAQALHSLANLLAGDRSRAAEAEELYNRSIAIDEASGNSSGVAKALHSLAKNLLAKDPARAAEAEETFERSLAIDEAMRNDWGVAQTLHSLGKLLERDESRQADAEDAYRRSLSIGERISNQNHIAQILRSLALFVAERSLAEAIAMLNRSLEINRSINNAQGVKIVQDSLAQLLQRPKV